MNSIFICRCPYRDKVSGDRRGILRGKAWRKDWAAGGSTDFVQISCRYLMAFGVRGWRRATGAEDRPTEKDGCICFLFALGLLVVLSLGDRDRVGAVVAGYHSVLRWDIYLW